jgi:hypothetical protein
VQIADDMRLSGVPTSRDLKDHDNHRFIPIKRLRRIVQTGCGFPAKYYWESRQVGGATLRAVRNCPRAKSVPVDTGKRNIPVLIRVMVRALRRGSPEILEGRMAC